jgi:hypothetical protein
MSANRRLILKIGAVLKNIISNFLYGGLAFQHRRRCEKIKNKEKNVPVQQRWTVWKTLERNLIKRNHSVNSQELRKLTSRVDCPD